MKEISKKYLDQVVRYVLGSKEEFEFENRLVLSYILFASVISFSSIWINISLNLSLGIIAVTVFSFVFYFSLYILGRFYKKVKTLKLLFSSYSLVFCNFYWLYNYGSIGSAPYFFLVYYFIMLFTWEKRQLWIITGAVLLNLCILCLFELFFPHFLSTYSSEATRILDNYTTAVFVMGFFSIIIMNTKRHYIEQYKRAQQSDQLKSAFLANISHEIRTPLNAIMGFTHILMKPELIPAKREQYSKLVMDNSRYLMNLMSDIIDISLIESGQLKIAPYKFDLVALLQRVHEIHGRTLKNIEKADVQFILSVPSHPYLITTDEFRAEQVITNLFHNAIKFTSHGHIRMGFFTENDNVILFVEDTGRGIHENFKKNIFNRFEKNDEGVTKEMNRGAGIGLSLCKELAEMLGGKIWFESELYKGSTFYFSLPL